MKSHSASPAKFTIACAVLLGAASAGRAHAEEYFKSYPVSGRANVQVDAQWGAVRVTTSQGNKVEFDVTYDKRDWASEPRIQSRNFKPRLQSQQSKPRFESRDLEPRRHKSGVNSSEQSSAN